MAGSEHEAQPLIVVRDGKGRGRLRGSCSCGWRSRPSATVKGAARTFTRHAEREANREAVDA